MDPIKREGIPDDFDSFVMTTRATPDDVAELASYLYTNSQVFFFKLFKIFLKLFLRPFTDDAIHHHHPSNPQCQIVRYSIT